MQLQIDPMTQADALALEQDLRPTDAAELAAAGLTATAALRNVKGWALHDGDTLLAVFGVQPFYDNTTVGVPWLLCTNQLQRLRRRQVLLLCNRFVGQWSEQFASLRNFVHRHNAQAIHLIRWLGFTVDTVPTGPGGEFYLFHWERPNV